MHIGVHTCVCMKRRGEKKATVVLIGKPLKPPILTYSGRCTNVRLEVTWTEPGGVPVGVLLQQ